MTHSIFTNRVPFLGITMKTVLSFFIIWTIALISGPKSYAFDEATYVLQANDPSIIKSAKTINGQSYTITVSGTYSMWPEFTAYGVDAMYIYHVPSKQVTSGFWPMEFYKPTIGPNPKVVIYELPIGVDKDIIIPTDAQLVELSTTYRMSGYSLKNRIHPFAHMGFRFNNAPLKNYLAINRPFRNGDHTYSFTWIGDGNEISLQILDSLISRTERGVSGSYSDNTGSLTVKIEKTKNLVVCDVQPKQLTDSTFEVEVDVAVFTDSLIADSKNRFDTGLVAVFEKDYFLCPDRIECSVKQEMQDSLAIGLLIDRSGSMLLPIDSVTDKTIRIDAIKSAANTYIKTMKKADESFLMSFATQVSLDQDWTSDTASLKSAVNALQAEGWTSLYEALVKGIEKVRANPKPVKGIILLSDGADLHHPDSMHRKIYYSSVLKKLQESPVNVPIYCISLGLSNNPEDVAGRDTLKLIARESGGQYYLINSAKELNDLYADLRSEAIFRKKCCKIIYRVPKCKDKFDTVRTVTVVFPFEGKILTKSLTYRTKCDTTFSSISDELDELLSQDIPFQVSDISPNPGSGMASFAYEIPSYQNVSISILNQDGNVIRTLLNAPQDIGRYRLNIDLSSEPQGMYSIIIQHGGDVISRKMMIVR